MMRPMTSIGRRLGALAIVVLVLSNRPSILSAPTKNDGQLEYNRTQTMIYPTYSDLEEFALNGDATHKSDNFCNWSEYGGLHHDMISRLVDEYLNWTGKKNDNKAPSFASVGEMYTDFDGLVSCFYVICIALRLLVKRGTITATQGILIRDKFNCDFEGVHGWRS